MTQKWYPDTSSLETCAAGGTDPTNRDMVGSEPSSNTLNELESTTTYTLHWIFWKTVGTDGKDGTYNYSLDVSAETNADIQFRIARYSASGCTREEISTTRTAVKVAGIITGSFPLDTSGAWASGDYIVLEVELRSDNIHAMPPEGDATIRTGADSWIEEPSAVNLRPGVDRPVIQSLVNDGLIT